MSAQRPHRPERAEDPLRNVALVRAEEEAEGVTVFGSPPSVAGVVTERGEAQGIAVFEDPDATVPRTALRNGAPGEETLDADRLGLDETLGEDAYDVDAADYPEDMEP